MKNRHGVDDDKDDDDDEAVISSFVHGVRRCADRNSFAHRSALDNVCQFYGLWGHFVSERMYLWTN